MFKEVTNSAGIDYVGQSYGASWGDVNGDNLPDLWLPNHFARDILYVNQGDGTFTDATSEFLQEQTGDTHGAAWADFDNDGDQDLVQLVGAQNGRGSGSNRLYVNNEETLEDQASELAPEFHSSGCCCASCQQLEDQAEALGVDYPLSRGRTPQWLDFDNNGLLDLVVTAKQRPDGQAQTTVFRQTSDGFEDAGEDTGLANSLNLYGFLSDLSGDGNLDLGGRENPIIVYDTTSIPFEDITANLIPEDTGFFIDAAAADFNGDLQTDVYLTHQGLGIQGVSQVDSNYAKARLRGRADQKGTQFSTAGEVTFNFRFLSYISPTSLTQSDIYIGSDGLNPAEFESGPHPEFDNTLQLTLSPDDPRVQGINSHTPGVDKGVYIGYDPTLERWQLLLSSSDSAEDLAAIIQTDEPLSALTAINVDTTKQPLPDQLLANTDQGFVDRSKESRINSISNAGRSVATGDFDNDMDIDVYVVASGAVANLPNILYENQGDGTFIPVPEAGGAAGTNLGVAGSVTTADYDLDGFLDLLVNNGEWPPLLIDDGPTQLFRNEGNENHWLAIDLEGVVSNRDGIGAQVLATAGGVTQLRELSGGMHRFSQNHQRIHFGLADNAVVDEIVIKWPSGIVQRIENIRADQLIRAVESSNSFTPGQPAYENGSEEGVFLWKETFNGPYYLRTNGAGASTQFSVNLISTDELESNNPVGLEPNDRWQATEFGFSLDSRIIDRQDGINFQLAPGAKALLSVTQDGSANPRQLNAGGNRDRLSPTGWISDSEAFPVRPTFNAKEDLGLAVGQGENSEAIEFRWGGSGSFHRANLTVLASEKTPSFSPVELDGGGTGRDELTTLESGVEIRGNVGSRQDGLDVATPEPVQIGFAYEQDDLFQPHRVNSGDDLLGMPNAYWVPLATPYGQPEYEASEAEGLFLWKDEQEVWHLRATGGTSGSRYVGSIVSDTPAETVQPVLVEADDVIDTANPSLINFDLKVLKGLEDGVDFQFPAGAALSLRLEEATDEAAGLIRIGAEQWPVSTLPLDLSGW